MKKIKLIAPILGAAATLGTAIPLASCGPEKYDIQIVGEDLNITVTPTKFALNKDLVIHYEAVDGFDIDENSSTVTVGETTYRVEELICDHSASTVTLKAEQVNSKDIIVNFCSTTKLYDLQIQEEDNITITPVQFKLNTQLVIEYTNTLGYVIDPSTSTVTVGETTYYVSDLPHVNKTVTLSAGMVVDKDITAHFYAMEAQPFAVSITGEGVAGTVEITSSQTIQAKEGEAIDTVISWKHTDTSQKERNDSYLYDCSVTDAEDHEIEGVQAVNVGEWCKTRVTVPADKVVEGMKIHIVAKYMSYGNKVFTLDKTENSRSGIIKGYGATTDNLVPVNGMYAEMSGLTDDDNTIEFVIDLAELSKICDIKNETNLYIYITHEDASRSNPYDAGGVKYRTGDNTTEISAVWSAQRYSLRIPVTVDEQMLKDGTVIVGWFNYSMVAPWFDGLNGGKICVFPGSEVAGR